MITADPLLGVVYGIGGTAFGMAIRHIGYSLLAVLIGAVIMLAYGNFLAEHVSAH